MNYGNIKKYDIANGEGVRTSLFVSGCLNHCSNCFQPETWSFHYGKPYTKEVQDEILASLKPDYIQGLSVLGGEPFEFENQKGLVSLLKEVKRQFPTKNIWCYTGYVLDQDLLMGGKRHGECTDEMLSYIDILVDGPFIEAKKDISLAFRGSSNQRVIDLVKSLKEQEIILYLE